MLAAISSYDGEQLQKLLKENDKVISERIGSDENTPLHEACLKSSFEMCKILLDNKADPSLSNKNGNRALHKISMIPETDMEVKNKIIELLISHKADINATNIEGKSAIHVAALKGNTNTLIILSNQDGCKLDIVDK